MSVGASIVLRSILSISINLCITDYDINYYMKNRINVFNENIRNLYQQYNNSEDKSI